MLPPALYWAILLSIVFYAFRSGAVDERVAALTCLVGTIATFILSNGVAGKYSNVEVPVLLVDLCALFVFTGIALKSSRFWPLWVAGFQLSSMLAHFLRAFGADMIPRVYAAAERFWIYPIFLAITVGIWRAKRRERDPQTRYLR
jgi:hypothetical protein